MFTCVNGVISTPRGSKVGLTVPRFPYKPASARCLLPTRPPNLPEAKFGKISACAPQFLFSKWTQFDWLILWIDVQFKKFGDVESDNIKRLFRLERRCIARVHRSSALVENGVPRSFCLGSNPFIGILQPQLVCAVKDSPKSFPALCSHLYPPPPGPSSSSSGIEGLIFLPILCRFSWWGWRDSHSCFSLFVTLGTLGWLICLTRMFVPLFTPCRHPVRCIVFGWLHNSSIEQTSQKL